MPVDLVNCARPSATRPSMVSDAELVRRACSEEIGAFGSLVERYESLARGCAWRTFGDSHSVDDIVQDAFIIAYEGLPKLREPARFGAWLLGIVRRRAARATGQHLRRAAALEIAGRDKATDTGKPHAESIDLLAIVDRLPDHQQIVIGLRHFEGHSVSEIAEITGHAVGTVTKQLSRAHAQLRKWITEEENR